jgi:RNA polymerase sigma factor (sigma-70 family)
LGNRQLFPAKSPKELLADFKETGANAPFEEIVRRYAAMVYGVCLRVTGDKHDAEDATQAVFLSLALQAKTSREIKYIGPWLQKVAHRLALDVKKSKTRRKKREEKLADDTRHAGANGNGHNGHNGHHPAFTGGNGHGINPADSPGNEELKSIMMEELNQLPPKYRMPLVMHYFGGLSREEMSEQLGCNPSTLGVRVHRGKAMLGTRLAKRGIALSAIALAVLLEHVVKHAAVQPLAASATTAGAGAGAMAYATAGNGAMSSAMRAMVLVRTAMKAVAFAKLKSAVAIVIMVISFALSTQASVRKFVSENLHIPIPSLDIGKWIRPMFQGILPDLRADGSTADERPEDSHSIVASRPIPRTWELMLDAQPNSPFAAAAGGSAATPSQAPLVRNVAPREVELPRDPAPYTALAKLILDPPNLRGGVSTFTLSDVYPMVIGGSSNDRAQQKMDPSTPSLEQPLAASSSGDVYVGAGGGAAGGKPELYILPANQTLESKNVVVGDAGHGLFRQLGDHRIAGDLTLGRQKGSSGTYEQQSGTLTAKNEVIGDKGEGAFIQHRGVNIVDQSIIVGRNGAGTYHQIDGETIVRNTTVWGSRSGGGGNGGNGGGGEHVEAVASADTPNGLHLGENPGSTGKYVMDGGLLTATPQVIGNNGSGTFVQNGGTNFSGEVLVGAGNGGNGNYQLIGGKLVLLPTGNLFADVPAATGGAPPAGGGTIRIGDNGYGTFTFGNSGGTGTVYSVGDANSVVVRGKPTGDGVIVGHGKFDLTGRLVMNSQVIADGYRKDRTLDFSSFTEVTSNIENPPWGGAAGWFARRKGKLLLPPIPVAAGTGEYTWGEDAADPMLDLVNSVRFKMHDAAHDGAVSIALLSPLRSDIPALPEEHKFIGLWSIDAAGAGDFQNIDIQVRYDDAMADTLGLSEDILKLWEYDGVTSTWRRVDGDPVFARDTFNHIISGRISSDATYFAVSAPEPGAAVLVIVAGAALLRRRRRQCV